MRTVLLATVAAVLATGAGAGALGTNSKAAKPTADGAPQVQLQRAVQIKKPVTVTPVKDVQTNWNVSY